MAHLTIKQRYTISLMLALGKDRKSISQSICRSESVLCRELKRNSDPLTGLYDAEEAHERYMNRQASKAKKIHFTTEIESFIKEGLSNDYSPEQISGRAKIVKINCVSYERIYQYIWKDKADGGKLHERLRHKGRKYRKRGSAKDKRGKITKRVDIDQRPAIVDEKVRFGDCEIDTVIGQNHQGALLTINDRVTGLVWIRLLEGKRAEPLTTETIAALLPFKDSLNTITSDNGKEFAGHEKIAKELGIDFYFAKPYHSWERGANENTNGLIRQYFTKGSSFENITPEMVSKVQDILNNRPRKRLGYLTPNEFYKLNFAA